MARVDEPLPPADEEIADEPAISPDVAISPQLMAGSISEYLKASFARIRAGETGVLPVVGGLLLVSILFQILNSEFLTSRNLVNLLVQAAVVSVLAMGEIYALLLGEIDLSIGFVAGIGGLIVAEAVKPTVGWEWWIAILVGLLATAAIGALQGTLITRIGLPSFVVTLAGLLFWQGVMLKILVNGGSILVSDNIINDITAGNLTPAAGWVVMFVIVGIFGVMTWRRDARRRAAWRRAATS